MIFMSGDGSGIGDGSCSIGGIVVMKVSGAQKGMSVWLMLMCVWRLCDE